MTIFAAGAVLWREVEGKLLVAVIHRARYDDWSFPKGKQDPGENLPQTAVREIREETGLKIKLGVRLKVVHYTVGDDIPKEVHYWAARVTDSALANSKFEPSEEVASVEWKSPEEVRGLLTYDFDREVLDRALDLHALGHLRTKPVIVLDTPPPHREAIGKAEKAWMTATDHFLTTATSRQSSWFPFLTPLLQSVWSPVLGFAAAPLLSHLPSKRN